MKIERPTIYVPPEPLQEVSQTPSPGKAVESESKEPVQLENAPQPKTDSVEIKANSYFNFENAPKLDPAKTNVAQTAQVPAAMIPGVPFREKVELPKTLPNGTSVDSGVATGDLGFGRKRTGPNHMGIDLKGTELRNQLDDALKLKEGSQTTNTAPSDSVVDPMSGNLRPSAGRTPGTYDAGFQRPGTSLISADKDGKGLGDKAKELWEDVKKGAGEAIDELRRKVVDKYVPIPGANELLDGPETIEKVTGDSTDLVRGGVNVLRPDVYVRKFEEDKNKYVNPDAPEGTQPTPVTDEALEKASLRFDATKLPSNEGLSQDEIDGKVLSGTDPRRALISNPLPEDQTVLGSTDAVDVMLNVKGPDTVNPRDPEQTGGGPIIIDPNRPK